MGLEIVSGRNTCLLCWRVDRPQVPLDANEPGSWKSIVREFGKLDAEVLAWLKKDGQGYQAGSGKGG